MAKGNEAGNETLASVREAIKERGYGWHAAPTSVSQLSAEQQNNMLGLAVEEEELRATENAIQAMGRLEQMRSAPAAPLTVDWRNRGGNWITPAKDQGTCGSCVAFACIGTMEAQIRIACQNASMQIDLSEANLFYCGCGNCCAPGWNFAPALDFLKDAGAVLESCFPYTPGNQPCKQGCPVYAKIDSWLQILAPADRQGYLAATGPMVGGMEVYSDFFSYSSGVYRPTSSVFRGLHAVGVVGYDDTQKCWICKNSWGTGWGEGGFFRIGYGECGVDTRFAAYGVSVRCPVPSDPCRMYVKYLVKVLDLARQNRALWAYLRYYVCRKGWSPAYLRIPAFVRRSVAQITRDVLGIMRRCPSLKPVFCKYLR